MIFTSSDIEKITGGRLTGNPDLVISDIITDSRQFKFTGALAFIAVSGKNHDGHQFIDTLYKEGIRVFIVERLPDAKTIYSGAAFILTDNTIRALQCLASHVRRSFSAPVIAVTGSAGKTVVKEWLADVLGLSVAVVRSPKSYNSQIGVPLSVLKLDEKYKYGIFEAGISLMNEMEALRKVIDPDIGVITNIGDAHSENFPDNQTKAKEKLKLFKNASVIVYCRDHEIIHRLIREDSNLKSKTLIDWSLLNQEAGIFVRITPKPLRSVSIHMRFRGKTYDFKISFDDRASVENALTVASVCLALNIDPLVISKGLAGLLPVAMRMEMKAGINNCELIEDYYNSDPGSLSMALEYLRAQKNRKRTLLLSDFLQTGRDNGELYGEVADLVRRSGIDRFIGIGPGLAGYSFLFGQDSRFYYSTEEFMLNFNPSEFKDETILLKGARIFEFERIGRLLEQQVHQTLLEINLDAIAHNLNEFRRIINPGTRIMAMVKAFAYGSGPSEIAALLEYQRVSYLGVAYADEGIELRKAGVTTPVMVMNPDSHSSELLIRYNLEPEIYSFHSLEKFSEVASRYGVVQYPVHIKIDTGMHRLGFLPEEVPDLLEKLKELESVRVASVFSHFASSEDEQCDRFTHYQAEIFLKAVSQIREATGYPFLRHICNSSGIVRFPQYQFDMVRPGIGIYGIGNFRGLDLRPAGRFKTKISQIKKVKAGEPVGYNCADVSDKERIIAILPVGYADGLNRMLGNRKGSLMIKGKRVPIIGNICMDMCIADITGLDADTEDEAEIFGENITIDEIADLCRTIPYEILTSIPGRVKRVFYRE